MITLFNPLPAALRRFEDELISTIRLLGENVQTAQAAPIEVGHSKSRRITALIKHLVAARRTIRLARDPVIVLWPALGWLELFLWVQIGRASRRVPVFIIYHDPRPLRKQFGLSSRAAKLTQLIPTQIRPTIVTLSPPATTAVRSMTGRPAIEALHPAFDIDYRERSTPKGSVVVGVFGQFKVARNTELLEMLAGRLPDFTFTVSGRGWPSLIGCNVDPSYLSEEELDRRIAASSVVLLPYKWYFQSGIAIRALELGVPVVGERTPFLEALYPTDYPGFVDETDVTGWETAIRDAAEIDAQVYRQEYTQRARSAWRGILSADGGA